MISVDHSGEDSNMGSEDEFSNEESGNYVWAKAMSNILNSSSKKDGSLILSKAKTDSYVKRKKVNEIEMVDSSGKVIEGKKAQDKSYVEMKKIQKENHKKKLEWEAMCRVKPDVIKKEKERQLIKIATRGVVHLFNTVEDHQKTVKNKKSAKHNEKLNVVKGTFMDMLKQHSAVDRKKQEEKKEEAWSILKDDFMMCAEMKDWDNET